MGSWTPQALTLILALTASVCFGQGIRYNNIRVIPSPNYSQVGQIDFVDQTGTQSVSLSAPSSVTTTTTAISAAADSSGVLQCTVSSTAGMLTGQSWYVSGITGSGFAPNVYTVTVINGTTFSLNGITAAGSYTVSGAAATRSTIWHLPATDGYAGSILLTDGAGNLSFGAGPTLVPELIPVVIASATPDARLPINIVQLTGPTVLNLPIGVPTTGAGLIWTLIAQQNSTGGNVLDISAYSAVPYLLSNAQSAANTECIQVFYSDSTGTRALYPAQIDLRIP